MQLRATSGEWRALTDVKSSWLMAHGSTNLLELAVTAARHRATLGEISDALEKVFGRYKRHHRSHQRRLLSGSHATIPR
jgi:methylmalonyl-CoA mutase N-terminal domain/subunit